MQLTAVTSFSVLGVARRVAAGSLDATISAMAQEEAFAGDESSHDDNRSLV